MNVMIALPGGKYFAVPRDVLEKHAVSKADFDRDLDGKWKAGNAVFQGEVEGQEDGDDDGGGGGGDDDGSRFVIRTKTAVMGVRG